MSLAVFELDAESRAICIVCGLGMIGATIAYEVGLRSHKFAHENVSWKDPTSVASAIKTILKRFRASKLELVWSAGSSGFYSGEDQLDAEVSLFTSVVYELRSLLGDQLRISVLSSAGGIYENSGLVTEIDQISPSRPYAFAKLEQEAFLRDNNVKNRIYRVSSAYGAEGTRLGLIRTLIMNTHSNKSTQIHAQQNTLRDYIFSGDIARIICEDIINNKGYGVSLAVSGRAVSINTLLNLIHRITHKVPRVYFSNSKGNETDISFDASLVKGSMHITSLEEGLRLLNSQMRCS